MLPFVYVFQISLLQVKIHLLTSMGPMMTNNEWNCVVVQQLLVVMCQQNNDVTMHISSTPVVTLDEIETVLCGLALH